MVRAQVPTGGQLLGKIVSAFELYGAADDDLREAVGKMGQRLFAAGCNVRHACGLIGVLGWILVGTPLCDCEASPIAPQLFAPLLFARLPDLTLSRSLVLSAHAHALAWDQGTRAAVIEDPTLERAMLRFATLDLGVKTAWFRAREGLPPPDPSQLPAWAQRTRLGEPLKQLMDQTRRSSLEAVGSEARISIDAIKRWRRGQRRPTNKNLDGLLSVLLHGADRERARAALSRHYALASLADDIRDAFGEAYLHELAQVYLAVVCCEMNRLDHVHARAPSARQTIEPLMLAFSSWLIPLRGFLRLADHHAPSWREDITRAAERWQPLIDVSSKRREVDIIRWIHELHGGATWSEKERDLATTGPDVREVHVVGR